METKKSTFSTYYYINRNPKRIDSENRCMVFVRISVNGDFTTASIKRKVKVNEWNPSGGGRPMQNKSDEVRNLADYIRKLETKMLQVYEDLMRTETYFTAEMIKLRVFGMQKDNNISVLELFQEKIDKEDKLFKAGKKSNGDYKRFFIVENIWQTPDVEFMLHPNLAKDNVTFSYRIEGDCSQASIIMYNSGGLQMENIPIEPTGNRKDVIISQFPNGIYYCRLLIDGKAVKTAKLVSLSMVHGFTGAIRIKTGNSFYFEISLLHFCYNFIVFLFCIVVFIIFAKYY